MAKVVLVEQKETLFKGIPITSHRFTIGRGLDNSHVVNDLSVSRKHTILQFQNNEWHIIDVSANGTWLNECLICKNGSEQLKDGDTIKLSESCKYTFKIILPDKCSGSQLIEEEIAIAAEEVITNIDAFNAEFLEADVIPAPLANIAPTIMTNQPSNTKTLEDNASSGANSFKLGFVEDRLQCSICTELMIKAVTLSCAHSFCSYCIAQWQKTKKDCPICRTIITTKCSTLILDNYISDIMESASDEDRKRRQEIILQREASDSQQGPSTSVSNVAASAVSTLIEISSEDDMSVDEEEDEPYWDDSEYDSDDDGERSTPYYGGYGSCYTCGSRGHWSNGCPRKRKYR